MSKALVIKGANFEANRLAHVVFDGVHAESITLSAAEIESGVIGQTYQLTAAVTPSDAIDAVLWTSSDETVATVDDYGTVTITGCGTCTITATAGEVSDACDVTVKVTLDGLTQVYAYMVYAPNSSNDITGFFMYESDTKSLMSVVSVDPTETKLLIDFQMTTGVQSDATLKPVGSRPLLYTNYGWVVPIKLASNCTKIKVKSLDSTFGSYVFFFKSNVASDSCGGYIASRKPTGTWSGYNPSNAPWAYGAEVEYAIPDGYDSVAIEWKAGASSPFNDFRNATEAQLAAFKIVCE